ncbi:MAG: hypothetical protein ACLRTA_09155 [Clostridia bacterium]
MDDELAYVVTAKSLLFRLPPAENDAEKAKEVVENYHPIFTKDAYIQYMNSFISVEGGSPTEINAHEGRSDCKRICQLTLTRITSLTDVRLEFESAEFKTIFARREYFCGRFT